MKYILLLGASALLVAHYYHIPKELLLSLVAKSVHQRYEIESWTDEEGALHCIDKRKYPCSFGDDEVVWRAQQDECEYCGSIKNFHIIFVQAEGDTWRNYEILITQEQQGKLAILDGMAGTKQYPLYSPSIENERLYYTRLTIGQDLVREARKLFPDLEIDEKITQKVEEFLDQYGSYGEISYEAILNDEGKIKDNVFYRFHSPEGLRRRFKELWGPCDDSYTSEHLKDLILRVRSGQL